MKLAIIHLKDASGKRWSIAAHLSDIGVSDDDTERKESIDSIMLFQPVLVTDIKIVEDVTIKEY